MTTSSIFCTECGSANKSENRFCIVCATALTWALGSAIAETTSPVSSLSAKAPKVEQVVEKPKNASRKRTILLVAAVILSFAVGVGLTSQNVLSAIVGDRFTEKELKDEKKTSYKIGYDAGKVDGYDSGEAAGYSRGYSSGENDGCYKVFEKAEGDQLIAIFYPYRASNTGDFYITRSGTC